ncbi:MAG: carboxypeptidase-like regulatory domain-containing protein [Phycisphaerales bacterium JB040]
MKHAPPAILLALCCASALGQADVEVRVRDQNGDPAPRSNVVVCHAPTGIPVLKSGVPFTRQDPEQSASQILFVQTDRDGLARFEDLPPGSYRVVAQAWEGAPSPFALLDPNGVEVHLRGVSRVFDVPESGENHDAGRGEDHHATIRLELAPPGTGVLEMDLRMPNDETLVVVSAAPMGADPVLGFAGWNGDFMRGMLGGNRMPAGRTRFTGLPEGEVHVGVFAGDNVPGFGAATVRIDPERVATLDVPLVVMWASGVHSPPPALEPLAEKISGLAPEQMNDIAKRFRAGPDAARGPVHAMASLAPLLDETYTFEDGEVATLGEVFAALAYTLMQRTITGQGYRPNAYRPPTVTYEGDDPRTPPGTPGP